MPEDLDIFAQIDMMLSAGNEANHRRRVSPMGGRQSPNPPRTRTRHADSDNVSAVYEWFDDAM